ncbi:hypothetical protein THZB04_10448 [Vibrio owensii]|nr:hypothetical protein THZB04_10448 [Vibrio owensii]
MFTTSSVLPLKASHSSISSVEFKSLCFPCKISGQLDAKAKELVESSVAVSALRVIPFMMLIPFVFTKYNYSHRNQIDQKSR